MDHSSSSSSISNVKMLVPYLFSIVLFIFLKQGSLKHCDNDENRKKHWKRQSNVTGKHSHNKRQESSYFKEDSIIIDNVNLEHSRIDELEGKIHEHQQFQTIVIGVAGGSGSGKTTLASAIVDALGAEHITHISHDSYYKDLSHLLIEERESQNFDHPDALDTQLLSRHLLQLKNKQGVAIPIYDFHIHTRLPSSTVVYPRHIILVEGILIFTDPTLCDLMDIKIFVDTDDDIRLIRRIQRDTVERGRSIDKIMNQYLKTVRPMHLQFVQPSKRNADIIVPFGLNSVALDLVISKLKRVLHEAQLHEENLRLISTVAS